MGDGSNFEKCQTMDILQKNIMSNSSKRRNEARAFTTIQALKKKDSRYKADLIANMKELKIKLQMHKYSTLQIYFKLHKKGKIKVREEINL